MIDGTIIFRLHDSQGLPFDYILDELKENRQRFDVTLWMHEAINHAWSYDKIMRFLCTPLGEEAGLPFKHSLTRIYLSLTKYTEGTRR